MAVWEIEGKTVLVTGGTNGIGRATALELARRGARVSIVGRDEQRCRATRDMILQRTGREVAYQVADLSSQAEVRRLAAEFLGANDRLDVLVNNAGAIIRDREESVDGMEMTLALNHLAPFLLTSLLIDVIRSSSPARIVNVSSLAHILGRIDFDDLQTRNGYSAMKAYSQSKLANILFTNGLAEMLEGTRVTANSLHPGIVDSGFGRLKGGRRAGFGLMNALGISPERGAETSIFLASSPEVEGVAGKYWAKKRVRTPSRRARDTMVAKRLWTVSEGLTGTSSFR